MIFYLFLYNTPLLGGGYTEISKIQDLNIIIRKMEGETRLKSSWDARQDFTKNLVRIIDACITSLVEGDYEKFEKLLRMYFSITKTYMYKENRESILKLFVKVNNFKEINVREKSSVIKNQIKDILQTISDETFAATSHLLLDASDVDMEGEEDWF